MAAPLLLVVFWRWIEVIAAVVVAALLKDSLAWKDKRTAVLVADPLFARKSGVPVAPELVTVIVVVVREAEEEAWNAPETWKLFDTVEEAEEIKPPT